VNDEDDLLEARLAEAAADYAWFLCAYRNINKEDALKYVSELLELRYSSELHQKANNNVSVKDDKTDYPYPPSKGDYVPPSRKEKSSDDPEVLHHCKLSSDINRARILQRKQVEDREKISGSFDDMKSLEANINSQINSLYGKMLFAKSSYEMDIIASSIETIIQKKKAATDLYSILVESIKSK